MESGVWSDAFTPVTAMRTAAVLSGGTMRCLRIYATPDGESHFGEVDIPATMAPYGVSTPFERRVEGGTNSARQAMTLPKSRYFS
jgi:hypothetical protein